MQDNPKWLIRESRGNKELLVIQGDPYKGIFLKENLEEFQNSRN